MMKRNDGFTLIELIVSVAIGSLITLAATTTLLLGLRINAQTRDNIRHQNTTTTLFQLVERISEEGNVSVDEARESISTNGKVIIRWDEEEKAIVWNESNEVFMENVQVFTSDMNTTTHLLTIEIQIGEDPNHVNTYSTSAYCRVNDNGGSTQ